jgi:predicted amidohydrolase
VTDSLRIALVQAASGDDPAASRARIDALLATVAPGSVDLIVTPEMTPFCGPRPLMAERTESIPGETSRWAAAWAAKLDALFIVGSLIEKTADSATTGRYRNTGVAIAPGGREIARYTKLHRFDVSIPGQVEFRESDAIDRGSAAPTIFAWAGWRIGWTICYDLRFPEAFFPPDTETPPELWIVPSAFTRATGVRHWLPLLQARAIETFAWIAAPNQTGKHPNGLESFGHSVVFGPDGNRVALLDEGSDQPGPPAILRATLDRTACAPLRQRIPALRHRLARVVWPGDSGPAAP